MPCRPRNALRENRYPRQILWDDLQDCGEPYRDGSTGSRILESAPACAECRVAEVVERGDRHIVIGEVADAHLAAPIDGRPDDAVLHMRELGDYVFYGG